MNSVGIQLFGGPADGRLLVIPGDPANPPRVYDGLIYEMGKRRLIYRRADGRGILGNRTPGADGPPWRYQYDGDRPARPDEETVVAYRWDSNRGGRHTSNVWCLECNTEFQQPGTADADLTARDITPGQTCDVCGKDILAGRLPEDQ